MRDLNEDLDKNQLHKALLTVFEHQKIQFDSLRLNQCFLQMHKFNYLEQLNDYFAEEQLRMKRVSLSPKHFKAPRNHFVVFYGEEKKPCALIAVKNRYYLYGINSEPLVLTKDFEGKLALTALQFIQAIPARDALDLLKKTLPQFSMKQILVISLGVSVAGFALPIANALAFNYIVPFNDQDVYLQMIAMLLAALIVTAGFELLKRLYLLRMNLIVSVDSGRSLWDRVLQLPLPFFERFLPADLYYRVQSIDTIRDMLDLNFFTQYFSLLFTMSNLLLLFYFSPILALIALALVFACLLIVAINTKPFLKQARYIQAFRAEVGDLGFQYLNAMDKIKLNASQDWAMHHWQNQFETMKIADLRVNQHINRIMILLKTLLALSWLGFFMTLAIQLEQVTIGNVIAFTSAFTALILALYELSGKTFLCLLLWPLLERVEVILQTKPEQTGQGARLAHIKGGIRVSKLCCSYPDSETDVLSDLSFQIAAGESVALVGASGCGKSTLFKCLLGMMSYQSGEIVYDGQELASLNLTHFRRHCGTVMQNSRLFAGSLYDNIRAGSDISHDKAMAVCRQLGVSDWIESLPMKLHTVITGGHATLSGGQQQLILLARAVANRPGLLFLDEATSALDNVSQARVVKALSQLEMTRLFIAHRESTVRLADKVLVMEKGRIIQQGSFDQLIRQEGVFQRLFTKSNAQSN